jgi:predicted ABC-type ATPase
VDVHEVIILGGPNGAGKTTSAQRLLPQDLRILEFVNADEIARGLSPFNPEGSAIEAGRIMLERMRGFVETKQSFAFETTCAGRSHARTLRTCRAIGYRITLFFLWLPSPEVAVSRVARRVRQGGHNIPPDVIRRRYWAGLRNMKDLYLPLAHAALIVDNSDEEGALIAEREPDAPLVIHDTARWALIEEATR